MSSTEYEGMADVSWKCVKCSTANCSSFLYNGYNLNITNSFQVLAGIPGDDSVFTESLTSVTSPFAPPSHSSPTTQRNSKPVITSLSTTYSHRSTETSGSYNLDKNQSNFRTLVVNCNSAKGKRAEIAQLLDYTDADAVLICESKLDPSVNSSEFLPKHYNGSIRKDRTINGGGVMIAIKSKYIVDEVEFIQSPKCEVVWAKIALANSSPMYIGSFYRPPNDTSTESLEALEQSMDHISNITKNNSKVSVVIGGDFNADGIDWETCVVSEKCSKKPICSKIIEIFDKFGLTQLQKTPTRDGAILDLYATNKPGLVKSIKTIPGISDHDILVIDSDIRAQTSKKTPHKVYKWGRADWDKMREETTNFKNSFILESNTRSVQENYLSIEDHLKSTLDRHVPSKMTRTRIDLPWFTQELRRKCKHKQRLYNRAKKTGKAEHKVRYKEAQKKTQAALKQAHWQYVNDILQKGLEENNNKPFWTYVRSQKQDNLGVSPLKEGGQLHSDRNKKCEILAKQFKSVFTIDQDDPNKECTLQGPAYPPIPELNITEEGVEKLLKNINPSKAAGPDSIPCKLLKELATELAPVLTTLFRQSLQTGELPSSWLTAWIAPVFKKGARNEPENYRPVSLTCVSCKLLEHILCTHLRRHMDTHGILTRFNHGFRRKHSCESQLLVTTHDLYSRMDKKEEVDMAVLDFSKAFDTVPHQRLLGKLELMGIHGHLHSWIKSFLTLRTQSVLIEGQRSHEDRVDSGVPQGTVLGPLLFLCYINDLPSVLDPNTAVRLFADDCLIYRSIRSVDDRTQLQMDLNALSLWGRCWGMKFNTKKSHIMQIANRSGPRFYELDNSILSNVQDAKYLGVTLTSDMTWTSQISAMTSKAHQRLGFVRRNLRGAPYKHRAAAYTSLVRSHLEYCGVIWDPTTKREIDKLERVQRQSARWARGQYGITSVTKLLKDLQWAELADRRRDQRLALFYKLLNGLIAVPPDEIDIVRATRPARLPLNQLNLCRPRASRKASPLWHSTVFRTIPQWNSLPATVAEACSPSTFKSRLAALNP